MSVVTRPARLPLLTLLAAFLGGCATTAGPAPTSPGASSEASLAAAQQAEGSGQTRRALDLYLAVAHRSSASSREQAEALWHAALLRLGPGEVRDVAEAQKLLDRLREASPSYAARSEVAAVTALLADVAAARSDVDGLTAELAAAKAAARAGGDAAELKRLRAELAQAKNDLAEARDEIARKEEALRKIKETLVGKKDG